MIRISHLATSSFTFLCNSNSRHRHNHGRTVSQVKRNMTSADLRHDALASMNPITPSEHPDSAISRCFQKFELLELILLFVACRDDDLDLDDMDLYDVWAYDAYIIQLGCGVLDIVHVNCGEEREGMRSSHCNQSTSIGRSGGC